MTIIEVVGIVLMFAVSVAAIAASAVVAIYECRMLRMQREWIEKMKERR